MAIVLLHTVYIVLIDSKGIMAFQPFTLDRWAKCQAIYNRATDPKKSHLLFKIRLSNEEGNLCKAMIKSNKFMVVADYLVRLGINRGEVE